MNEKDFTAIVNETKSLILSAIGNHLAARFHYAIDDVAQETYMRAYNGLVKNMFREESAMSSWLYSIARNEALRMNKKLSREESKVEKSALDYNETEQNSYEANLALTDLADNIERLPEKYRSVMALMSHGYTVNEIADKLDIKSGTVKSRSFKGREMLQKMMKEA